MRLDQLTFTRFFAAIAIVIYHYGVNILPFNHQSINYIFTQANIGVSYFFVLSGFVMMIAYGKNEKINFISYIQKRLARLYPVYFLAIIILFLLYLASPNSIINYFDIFLNISLLQSWIPGKALSFNYPGWSLSTEMFFYLTFPFLFNHLYKKVSFQSALISVIAFFIASQAIFHYLINSSFYQPFPSQSHDFLHYFPLMHINEFLIGNVAGLFFMNNSFKERNYDILIITLITCIVILLKFNIGLNYHNGLLALLIVPLIIFMSLNNGIIASLSKIKYLVFLGEISYGIYILQVPIFDWGNALMKLKYFSFIKPELAFWINFAMLILCAGLSYLYIEQPLKNKINQWKFKYNN